MSSNGAALGDVQTPVRVARRVWRSLGHIESDAIVEPTIGRGNFATAAPDWAASLPWRAIDIHRHHVRQARAALLARSVGDAQVSELDIFTAELEDFHLPADVRRVLVVGNPPWGRTLLWAGRVAPTSPASATRAGSRGSAP